MHVYTLLFEEHKHNIYLFEFHAVLIMREKVISSIMAVDKGPEISAGE